MTTTVWAHLPNAPHIDRVLAHLSAHPQAWDAARGAARDAARGAALDAAWGAAWAAAWAAARDAARGAAWGAAWAAAWAAARDALAALIAWDDCAYILDLPVDAVRTLAGCGHHPAVLMLPAVIALQHQDAAQPEPIEPDAPTGETTATVATPFAAGDVVLVDGAAEGVVVKRMKKGGQWTYLVKLDMGLQTLTSDRVTTMAGVAA